MGEADEDEGNIAVDRGCATRAEARCSFCREIKRERERSSTRIQSRLQVRFQLSVCGSRVRAHTHPLLSSGTEQEEKRDREGERDRLR